jgi:hypothetical protein
MDEGFEFYFVEDEWCHRAAGLGYRTGYVAEAEIVHFGDATMAKLREWGQRTQYLGAQRYFARCLSAGQSTLWLIWLVMLSTYFIRGLVFHVVRVVRPKNEYGEVYLRLVKWVFRNRPGTRTVLDAISTEMYWQSGQGIRNPRVESA